MKKEEGMVDLDRVGSTLDAFETIAIEREGKRRGHGVVAGGLQVGPRFGEREGTKMTNGLLHDEPEKCGRDPCCAIAQTHAFERAKQLCLSKPCFRFASRDRGVRASSGPVRAKKWPVGASRGQSRLKK